MILGLSYNNVKVTKGVEPEYFINATHIMKLIGNKVMTEKLLKKLNKSTLIVGVFDDMSEDNGVYETLDTDNSEPKLNKKKKVGYYSEIQ